MCSDDEDKTHGCRWRDACILGLVSLGRGRLLFERYDFEVPLQMFMFTVREESFSVVSALKEMWS